MHAAFFRQLTSQLLDCKRSFVGKPQGMSPFPSALRAAPDVHGCTHAAGARMRVEQLPNERRKHRAARPWPPREVGPTYIYMYGGIHPRSTRRCSHDLSRKSLISLQDTPYYY